LWLLLVSLWLLLPFLEMQVGDYLGEFAVIAPFLG
jgi:hypothetical protein